MVKFMLKNVKDGCRLGELIVNDKVVSGNVHTPMCMLYTRGGQSSSSSLPIDVNVCARPKIIDQL